LEVRKYNWTKINEKICEEYFYNRFYLLNPTIEKVAQGYD